MPERWRTRLASRSTPGLGVPQPGDARASVWSRLAHTDRAVVVDRLDVAARALLMAMAFIVPTAVEPRTVDSFNLAKLTTVWFLGLLAFGAWALAASLDERRRRFPRSRIVGASFVFVAITTVATIVSVNRRLSFFGLYRRYEGLASLLLFVGVVLLVVVAFRGRADALRRMAITVTVASSVVSLYLIVQALQIDPIPWLTATGRVPPTPLGSLGNPEFTGAFLGTTVGFVIYLIRTAESRLWRTVWRAVGLLTLVGLWITSGRSGMIAAAVATTSYVLFRSRFPTVLKVLPIPAMVGALTLATFAAGASERQVTEGVLRTASLQYRAEMWKDAWRQVATRPVLGWGPDTFYGNYAQFRSAREARGMGMTIPEEPHNIYLARAVSSGLIGLGAYLAILWAALWAAAKGASRDPGPRGPLLAAYGAVVSAYAVQGVFSIDVAGLAFIGWLAVAGVAALSVADRAEGVPGEEASRRRPFALGPARVAATVGAAIVLLFALVAGFRPLRADHAAWVGLRRGGAWSAETLGFFNSARELNPNEAAYPAFQAGYLERVAYNPAAPFSGPTALRRAAYLYERAITLQPRNEQYIIGAARVYGRLGEVVQVGYFELGVAWLERAISLDPRNPDLRQQFTVYLSRWARAEPDPGRRAEISRRSEAQAATERALRRGPSILPH